MQTKVKLSKKVMLKAFELMYTAKCMTELYEDNFKIVSKYVHATSRGHEAIQLASAMHLGPQDFISPYYRDDAMLLGIGMEPHHLMLQLLAKKSDPFSGGRSYYSHPSLNDDDKAKVIHQSSSTGMQAIPTTGIAMGIQYKEQLGLSDWNKKNAPVVICSLGDASITEGEVSEAFQMAALRQLPILFLIQDNGWDISANAEEIRAQNAFEYIQGFKGIEALSLDGSDFISCYESLERVVKTIRKERRPFLIHANVPLLNHHTSGVRKEWYRDDLEEHKTRDPLPRLRAELLEFGIKEAQINKIEDKVERKVEKDFKKALQEEDPTAEDLMDHRFAPVPHTEEVGTRSPEGAEEKVMVDCALFAIEELMRKHKECLLYGQDVGGRLGGVFREAATLAQKFGDERVFNTPIQEAFIVGSTVGMSAAGLKPIVEVQFADYIWPGLNQLFSEVSRSYYLSNGKWPVSMILRVPIGAYGSGGPYHSSSVETVVANIRGVKIAYPSNGADLKGLLKAAYYDPNPCVIFEHKGLYWSKMKGTEKARSIMPDEDYVLPFGIGRMTMEAHQENIDEGQAILIVTYGMGVYWAESAEKDFEGQIGVLDLRTLNPMDEDLIFEKVREYSKCIVLTEESVHNSMAQSIAARIQEYNFEYLDGPVITIGAENTPAIPLNENLERAMLPSAEKLKIRIKELLDY